LSSTDDVHEALPEDVFPPPGDKDEEVPFDAATILALNQAIAKWMSDNASTLQGIPEFLGPCVTGVRTVASPYLDSIGQKLAVDALFKGNPFVQWLAEPFRFLVIDERLEAARPIPTQNRVLVPVSKLEAAVPIEQGRPISFWPLGSLFIGSDEKPPPRLTCRLHPIPLPPAQEFLKIRFVSLDLGTSPIEPVFISAYWCSERRFISEEW
jgi:hypothetical protein